MASTHSQRIPPPDRTRAGMLLRTSITLLVLVGGLGFLVYRGSGYVQDLDVAAVDIRWSMLGVALCCTVLMILCLIRVTCELVNTGRRRLPFHRMARVWMISNLGKYLPGKVLLIGARMATLNALGVGAVDAFALLLAELMILILVALALTAACAPWMLSSGSGWLYAPVAVVLLCVLQPRVFQAAVNLGLRLLKRPAIDLQLGPSVILKASLWAVLAWIAFGVSGWAAANMVAPVPWSQVYSFLAALPFSWAIGVLAIVAPGGLGVREVFITVLLTGPLPESVALSVAVLVRLLWFVVEGLGAAGTALFISSTTEPAA